jgi:hypothetical protein
VRIVNFRTSITYPGRLITVPGRSLRRLTDDVGIKRLARPVIRTTMLRALALLIGLVALLCLTAGRVAAQDTDDRDSPILTRPPEMLNPQATAAAETPTPQSTATPIRIEPDGPETPEPTPTSRDYRTPGYGNAAQQRQEYKARERKAACKHAVKLPTSHMLGLPGIVKNPEDTDWVPLLLLAVAGGSAIFVGLAVALRKSGSAAAPGSVLEGVGTMVAICGGIAGLVTTLVPAAAIQKRPQREVSMVVRDVKPRITRGDYLRSLLGHPPTADDLDGARLDRVDLKELGNVVWLDIRLKGFKGRPLQLQYGSYDVNGEALLPGTSKVVSLNSAEHDHVTIFFPAWVGYPRSARFKAEFRLLDHDGVQELAATGRMRGAKFRYAC